MKINYNLTGQTYGTLTAIEPVTDRSSNHVMWRCICTCEHASCPKELIIRGESLRGGLTKSCRWYRIDHTIHAAVRGFYTDTRNSANSRELPFELTLQQFLETIRKPCTYCGNNTDVHYIRSNKTRTGKAYKLRANGIDRVDSTLGYTLSNSVACCSTCNYAKRELSPAQYLAHCQRVVMFNTHD